MKRTSPKRKPKVSQEVLIMVHLRTGGYCACGCGKPAISTAPHHVFPKQRWPELINEPDNLIGVAADCHANHEVASKRLPRYAIRRAERLACTPAMKAYLDRTYDSRPLP